MSDRSDGVRILVVPEGDTTGRTRSWHLSARRWRVLKTALWIAAIVWIAAVATWWYVAAYAAMVPGLNREVAHMERELERAEELAARLDRMEARYAQMRVIVGAGGQDGEPGWLPLPGAQSTPEGEGRRTVSPSMPDAWPLVERGFITREHLVAVDGQHPGLDIAVAEGAYIRAAGAGEVMDVGTDPVYGIFVRIAHGEGLETMYAHASELFVTEGQHVEAQEVIALTGSTGRSTAPHLHFEVRRNGEPIDPREIMAARF